MTLQGPLKDQGFCFLRVPCFGFFDTQNTKVWRVQPTQLIKLIQPTPCTYMHSRASNIDKDPTSKDTTIVALGALAHCLNQNSKILLLAGVTSKSYYCDPFFKLVTLILTYSPNFAFVIYLLVTIVKLFSQNEMQCRQQQFFLDLKPNGIIAILKVYFLP